MPSILIVAPSGTVKEHILFFTAKFFFKFSRVIGIVALLLYVEKANKIASFIPLKKMTTFVLPRSLIIGI